MTRTDEAKQISEEIKAALERKDQKRVLQLCDKLLAGYSDLINVPGVQDNRAVALCKIGRFSEAEPIFRQFLESHIQFGMPIASTTWMYHLLVCHHKGDDRKAMRQFVALDEPRAVALLNQEEGPELTRSVESEGSVCNPLDSADLARHFEELGKASNKCWDSYEAIESAGTIVVPHLLTLINSDNYLLRGRSIDLLSKVGDQRALEPLMRAAAIPEKEFRAMISVPPGAATVKIDNMDIPIQDLLTEYRSRVKDAYEAVSERVGIQLPKVIAPTPQPKTVKRWWQFWK